MGSAPTKLTSEECDALVSRVPYCYVRNPASKSNILRSLSKVAPSPTTISWLRTVIIGTSGSSTIWYGWEDDDQDTQHFIVRYPAYLEQYALAGGDLTALQEMDGPSDGPTLASLATHIQKPGVGLDFWWPDIPESGTVTGEPNSQSSREAAIMRREVAFSLGKIDGDEKGVRDEDLITIATKYYCISSPIFLGDIGALVTARDKVLTDFGDSKIRKIILKGCNLAVRTYIRDAAIHTFNGDLLQRLTEGTKYEIHGRLLNRYGTLGRVCLHSDVILSHVLGMPQTAESDVPTLLALLETMLGNIGEYQKRLRDINTRRLQEYQSRIPGDAQLAPGGDVAFPKELWDPEVGSWETVTNDEILNYLPGDLVPCLVGGEVKYYVRGMDHNKITNSVAAIEVYSLGLIARKCKLPRPAPLAETLEEISTAGYNSATLTKSGGRDPKEGLLERFMSGLELD